MRLTRQGFRTWLESKAPDEVVGTAVLKCECPLARFLTEQGMEGVQVGVGFFRYRRGEKTLLYPDLPPWADRFVELVDRASRYPGDHPTVTAAQALECLRARGETA